MKKNDFENKGNNEETFFQNTKNPDILEENGSEAEWFYIRRGQGKKLGPFDSETMIENIKSNSINRDDLVWKEGLMNWTRIDCTEFGDVFKKICPTLPKEIISTKFAWLFAIIPSLLLLSLYFLPSEPEYISEIIVGASVVIFYLFIGLDIKHLKKHGVYTGWIKWVVPFPPVYLFVRSAKVDHKYGYVLTYTLLKLLILSIEIMIWFLNYLIENLNAFI